MTITLFVNDVCWCFRALDVLLGAILAPLGPFIAPKLLQKSSQNWTKNLKKKRSQNCSNLWFHFEQFWDHFGVQFWGQNVDGRNYPEPRLDPGDPQNRFKTWNCRQNQFFVFKSFQTHHTILIQKCWKRDTVVQISFHGFKASKTLPGRPHSADQSLQKKMLKTWNYLPELLFTPNKNSLTNLTFCFKTSNCPSKSESGLCICTHAS